MDDHGFCRMFLRLARRDLDKHADLKKSLKGLSTWSEQMGVNRYFEVWDHDSIIWQGTAHCAFEAKANAINRKIEFYEAEKMSVVVHDMAEALEPYWRMEGQVTFSSAMDYDDELVDFIEANDLIGAGEDDIKNAIYAQTKSIVMKAAEMVGISYEEMNEKAHAAFDAACQ